MRACWLHVAPRPDNGGSDGYTRTHWATPGSAANIRTVRHDTSVKPGTVDEFAEVVDAVIGERVQEDLDDTRLVEPGFDDGIELGGEGRVLLDRAPTS